MASTETTHIEFLVEEPSAQAALTHLVPKILGPEASYTVHPHQGKGDLLAKLPGRLRGYSRWLPDHYRVVVLVDRDRDDCEELKMRLERRALDSGFLSFSSVGDDAQILNWIAIEELEAWLLGDVEAIIQAYPGVPASLASKAGFRDPDRIAGGTWEALERTLNGAGHHVGGLQKVRAAREIAEKMTPANNRSRSFCGFRDRLIAIGTHA